ncbi:MAG: metallophosphoesterase, partial [Victivallales bacterium]|nr:metallophosphoesterase [Victivallales bacterium]
ENWNFACGGAALEPPAEPAIIHGPWLTNPDVGKMTVAFSCNIPLGAAIRYRKIGEDVWQAVWHHRQGRCLRRTYHAIALEGLEPGASYEYNIIVIHPDNYNEIQLGDTHRFQVPDASRHAYSFFFTADLQFSLDRQHDIFGKLLKAADADSCDFFVLDGDVNSAFLPEDVIRGPFAQLCEHGAAEKPIIYVRGNHEMRGEHGDRFLDFFATNIGTTYDVLRIGDTAFLLLDSWEDKPAKTPGHTYCQWNLDDWFINTESDWLKTAVESEKWTGAKRRIVICHGAAYSHRDGCYHMPFVLQDMTDPYFEGQPPKSPLNLWLAGHVHRYLRSIPGTDDIAAEAMPPAPFKGGKTYTYPVLTVGGPGAGRVTQASCFRIDTDENGMTVRAWNQEGTLLEHLRYGNDGTCTEFTSLPHFTVQPQY